ncbi:MAG TPA: PEP/pyruvate-binding domain-containing protein, partial [Actinomycetota bacterium]
MGERHHGAVPSVVGLDELRATDPDLVGSKAAALARAASAGLPVLPGFVLTTGGRVVDERERAVWSALSREGRDPLVVRSSSAVEDVETSSSAGRFCSVLDVRGWEGFLRAVERVRASAVEAADLARPDPMAVLVQPQLQARCGGVMFGLDPVTGDRRHMVVEAVSGGPDALVSGRATAT